MTTPTEPNNSSKTSDTVLWRQAISICESLSGLSREQVLAELKAMELAPELLEKIQRIMQNMSASNPLLDQHDYQSLIENLKQGNHLIGQTIDGYLIKRLVAKGGMSTVYEAEYSKAKHQKTVAIKLLSPYGITAKAIELFNREQLILSKLSHPSIVAFHHSGLTADGTHYLVMEYIDEAENIIDYALNNKLSNQAIINQIKDLCEVFAYAHENQVIHRDIKAANILVDAYGQTKVIDFGIGRLEQLESQTVTQVFTPDAAAPEQLMGQGVSAKTDVFSLGALLLQLLIQKKPLPKTSIKNYDPEDDVKYIHHALKQSGLDDDLKNIINTAMHIDPKLRYRDMHAFAEDLNNWLNHKPVNATKDSFLYRCKKHYLRNKSLSLLLSLALLVSLLAVTLITALEFKNQKVTSQRDGSFALIEAMIDQANPVTNSDQKVDSDALVKSLNALANSQTKLLQSDAELAHFFYKELGSLYHSKGLYSQALVSYQKALSSLQQYTDENDEELIARELTLAHLLETTGKHKQAQTAAENMLVKLNGIPKLNPKHQLNTYLLLSKVHQYQAENHISHQYGEKALAWMARYPEIDPELQASVYNSLAVTNRNMGEIALAESQYNQAIELLRPVKAKKLELTGIMVNLAILKGRSGDMQASETWFNEAFEIIKGIDENHPHLAMAYLPYSTLLQFTDRLDQSEQVIEAAIRLLTHKGEDKHLATAHMKYARIGLYKNNINQTLEHVAKAYVLYEEIVGEDHPIIYDLYNMALWVLLLEPYQASGLELLKTIQAKPVDTALDSKEYNRFLAQQAWLNKQAIDSDSAEAVIPNYLFRQRMQSKQSTQDWFVEMQELHGGESEVFDAWLSIHSAITNEATDRIRQTCDSGLEWFKSSRLVTKVLIAEKCLAMQQFMLPESQRVFEQFVQQSKTPSKRRTMLIAELLTVMQ